MREFSVVLNRVATWSQYLWKINLSAKLRYHGKEAARLEAGRRGQNEAGAGEVRLSGTGLEQKEEGQHHWAGGGAQTCTA